MFLIGPIIDSSHHAPLKSNFDPQNEFYDLGNIVESDTRQRGIMNLEFLESLEYYKIVDDIF
jgi:hypothetical protein